MGGIVIVNDPRAQRNAGGPGAARRLRLLLGDDGEVADASTPEELERAISRFRAAGADVLGVMGGAGTGHRVLTAAARAFAGESLPKVLLLRGGAANAVARGRGIRGSPERILREVLARRRGGEPLRTAEADLLSVAADGGEARFGFIFGTGAAVAFLDALRAAGPPSLATAALLAWRAIFSAAVGGGFAASLARRERLRVVTDGDEWPNASYLAVAAATTPDVGLGFRAFSRFGEQPGSFHAVGVTGSPRRLALATARIRRGAPWRLRLAQDEVAREMIVEGERPRFTIDGDLYRAERAVAVRTGPGVEIVLPW